jgi:uncharacterized protein (UPF0333 family)
MIPDPKTGTRAQIIIEYLLLVVAVVVILVALTTRDSTIARSINSSTFEMPATLINATKIKINP